MSTMVLLLAGVTLNSFFSALILFVQYMADFTQTYRTVRWLMGDLDVGSFGPIVASLPLVFASFAIFAVLPRSLNLLSVGADTASTRGVDVGRTQRLAFLSASLATSAAVSLAGPIGFVGIVVPHLVRLMVGVDHRLVLPASALFGAAFLVGCDLVARTRAGARRSAGRRRHRDAWRAVLPMAAGQAKLILRFAIVLLLCGANPRVRVSRLRGLKGPRRNQECRAHRLPRA